MPNVIYLGPNDGSPHRHPKTVTDKTVSGALLPGTFVVEAGWTLVQATSGAGALRLLTNREYLGKMHFTSNSPLDEPYISGETGEAYILEPGQRYQARCSAGTYTRGQPLTVGASGYLMAATGSARVVAEFDQAGVTLLAGDLAAVRIPGSGV